MFAGLGQLMHHLPPEALAHLQGGSPQGPPAAQGPRNTPPPVQLPQVTQPPQFLPGNDLPPELTQAFGAMPDLRNRMHSAVMGPLMQPNFGVPQVESQPQPAGIRRAQTGARGGNIVDPRMNARAGLGRRY